MSDRPKTPARIQVDVAIQQSHQGALTCRLCGTWLKPGEPRILEHNPPRATLLANGETNPDQPKYLEWVHKRCGDLKTRGKEGESDKHSVADGDTHKIAKAGRLRIAQLAKDEVETRVGVDPGFRLKKKLDGSVVRRRTR